MKPTTLKLETEKTTLQFYHADGSQHDVVELTTMCASPCMSYQHAEKLCEKIVSVLENRDAFITSAICHCYSMSAVTSDLISMMQKTYPTRIYGATNADNVGGKS